MSARSSLAILASVSVVAAFGPLGCARHDAVASGGAQPVTAERTAAPRDPAHDAERWAARFARMDADRDGAITPDEAGERRWAFVVRADADHDGRVSRGEFDAARAGGRLDRREHGRGEGRGGRGGHRGSPDPTRWIEAFDQNGDGALQLAELPERMRARWSTADRNADGVLSVAELSVDRAAPAPGPSVQTE